MKALIAVVALVFIAVSLPSSCFADAASATAALAGVPVSVVTPAPNAVVKAMTDFGAKIPAELPAILVGILVFISELVMRLKKTAKPRSIMLVVAGFLGGLAAIFTKLSVLADGLVQNLKDPEEVAAPESEKKDG